MPQWLVTNNAYFSNITINHTNLSALPENVHLVNIPTISVDEPDLCTNTVEDQCHSRFVEHLRCGIHRYLIS